MSAISNFRNFFILSLLSALFLMACQTSVKKHQSAWEASIDSTREAKNLAFSKPESTPFDDISVVDTFEGLHYFKPDSSYKVLALFEKLEDDSIIMMTSSGEKADPYKRFARLSFELSGRPLQLTAYQNQRLLQSEVYDKYLFIPFKDLNSGKITYGGGRYLDIDIPDSNLVLLDFNQAYNPYCAYGSHWSCPIPPKENYLEVEINAGEKNFHN